MYLQLAESKKEGYTYLPYNETTKQGAYVRNDVLARAMSQAKNKSFAGDGLGTFLSDVWNVVKGIGGQALSVATGGIIGGPQTTTGGQPIIIQAPPPTQGIDSKTMLLIGGAALAAILIFKK